MKLKFIISLVLVVGFFAFFGIALAKTLDKASQGIGEDKKKASTINKEVDVVDDGESEATPTVDELDTDEGKKTIHSKIVVVADVVAECVSESALALMEECCREQGCYFTKKQSPSGCGAGESYTGRCDCDFDTNGNPTNKHPEIVKDNEEAVLACLEIAEIEAYIE